jgi:hypothetical protein
MKHNIIKTENYLLVVDDKKPIINSYYNESEGKVDSIEFTPNVIGGTIVHNIKAHLPLNNSPILAGIDLLPPLEDDDSKDLFYRKQVMNPYSTESQSYTAYEKGFIEGYNTAKENYDNLLKEVLVGFDLAIKKHLLLYTIEHSMHGKMCDGINKIRSEIIQSLQKPKPPVAFDCEVERYTVGEMSSLPLGTVNQRIKTTTNSQGITQWVGKYIYE